VVDNKARIARDIRGVLEDIIRVGDIVINFSNFSREKIVFTLNKVDVGHYRIVFSTSEIVMRDKLVGDFKELKKLKTVVSINA
jgi:hypothetical protein